MIIMNQRNFAKRSLKESKNDDIENYIDDLKTYSKKDVPSYSKSYYFWSYYEFNISDNEWTKVSLSGRDYTKSLKDANNFAKSDDDVAKAYLVFKNPNNPNENFKVIIKENDFYESKKSVRKNLKEGISAFNKAIAKKYNETEPNSVGQYYLDWRFDLQDEKDNIEAIADRCGVTVEFQSDEGYFEVFEESKKSVRKSLKEGFNDELIAISSDGETTLYLSDERQANHGKDPHYEFKLGENGYFTKYIRCDDNRCENVVLDWIKEFDLNISKSEISRIIKLHESKKSVRKSLKEYLVKGLDVDFVVDHLLSLEDPDNFDLINELGDLWELYKKSWNKFNKSLSDLWKVMKDIEKLDSFDKTCKEIIDAWYDDIEKIFYSDDNLENLKLNYGFEGNDVF